MRVKVGKQNSGITLIALVITIIVLLILAGISIATLTGENGVLTKASTAKEESKKAEYKEILQLIGNGIRDEKIIEQLDAKAFMDRYEAKIKEEIEKGDSLKGAKVERTNDTTIRVTTKEGYVYQITENEVKYLGKYGENTPPSLQEAGIDIVLDPEEYTIGNVTVKIGPQNVEGFTLQFSKDGKNWSDYTEEIIFKENGNIFARLINEIGEVGEVASRKIENIDGEDPNQATITFSSTTTDVETSITATVTQTDKGSSGVDFENSRWKFSTESGEIGKDPASYTGGKFSKSPEEITLEPTTPGTYYLHVLTVDNAGNKTEKVEGAVTVTKVLAKVGEIVTGKNKEYEKNGSAIIPVGFAIVPGLDDISQGLVISDVANDTGNTGNQFVWVPVTNPDNYRKNTGYNRTDVSSATVDYPGYLPTGITNEKDTVTKAKGFYIARFETGWGLVSKKGVGVWNGIETNGQANSQAKNFINNNYVKSALISGTQWDATMTFINGKKDGMGGTYYATSGSSSRHRASSSSGSNEYDRVCNIYDLEGNYYDRIAEKRNDGFEVYRGCWTSYDIYPDGYASASFRGLTNGGSWERYTFRMALYVMV